jgi:Raf kinase inhibitor-like YbhB/YbcL family protein
VSITIRSQAFSEGGPIPTRHTEDGANLSPPLTWSAPPKGTAELALIVDDPDAPTEDPWVHWVVYKIPAAAPSLPEGFHETTIPPGAPEGLVQGMNTWPTKGYRGPAPPKGHGVHHYHFKIFALDQALDLKPGLDKHALQEAMSGHILARGELVGTYKR